MATNVDTIYQAKTGEQFLVRPAAPNDRDCIINFLKDVFIHEEPHSRALGFTAKEADALLRSITDNSLQYPLSCIVRHGDTGQIVGTRLYTISDRTDFKPPEKVTFTPKVQIMVDFLELAKNDFWNLVDPTISRVIWREITSVSREHMRKGIAKFLATYQLTPEFIEKLKVQGIVSEAASIANQQLLLKNGYQILREYKHIDYLDKNGKRIFNCDDGTDRLILFFRRF